MAATIKDVARESGLAMSTVSKYINGGKVKTENARVIEETIQRLAYVPNIVARSLRISKTHTIGVLVSTMRDEHIIEIVAGIEAKMRSVGYLPIICNHRDDEEEAQQAIKFLIQKQVDGIVLEGCMTTDELSDAISEAGIPLVWMETDIGEKKHDLVMIDGTWGSYHAVEDLIVHGHTRIGIITGNRGYCTAEERIRGYRRVHEDYSIPVHEEYIYDGRYEYDGGRNGIQYFQSLKKKPSAVFISNYYMCMGAMAEIYRQHISIPNELSIVTYDDMELSLLTHPHLSAVKQPFRELGEKAIEVLLKRIENNYDRYPLKVRLKTTYFPRDSVAEYRK